MCITESHLSRNIQIYGMTQELALKTQDLFQLLFWFIVFSSLELKGGLGVFYFFTLIASFYQAMWDIRIWIRSQTL